MDYQRELLEEFVDKLPEIRKSLKLSQTELGLRVGLSRQSISSIERRSVPLNWDTFLAICLVILVNDRDAFKKFDHPERFQQVIDSLRKNN